MLKGSVACVVIAEGVTKSFRTEFITKQTAIINTH